MYFRSFSHENRKTSEVTDCEIIFSGGKSLDTGCSICRLYCCDLRHSVCIVTLHIFSEQKQQPI